MHQFGVWFIVGGNSKIYYTDSINTSEEAFNLVEKLNMSIFKVNLDIGTMIENKEKSNIRETLYIRYQLFIRSQTCS